MNSVFFNNVAKQGGSLYIDEEYLDYKNVYFTEN